MEPTAEKERATGYLNTAFVAAGGREPNDDEEEQYRRPECGKGTPYPAAKRQRTGKAPRTPTVDLTDLLSDDEDPWDNLPAPDPPTPPRTAVAKPVAAAATSNQDFAAAKATDSATESDSSDVEV